MRGGKRDGAGRPKTPLNLKKIQGNYRLPQWLVAWLRSQSQPQAQIIEDALIKVHKLKPPKGE